ncbi:hypothetical protein J7337_005078 [Fusarium musae]|uniref:Mid2 domain-containing protein n=1 Tax=Fusarium musae TaxID=1042133 RepID=A0A9P8IQS9_9HYPO|nr:hypothetical protein J7337_005078 [Fusarium musae]KAG9502252.1 hypothetical protein J7337_005078 [Fusarium musae]
MTLLTTIGLVLTLLAPLASCYSKFSRPPEWDSEQDADRDMLLNQHYDAGDKIPILYETNLKNTELWIYQVLDDIDGGAQIEGTGTYWQAQYDIAGALSDNEDSVYYFQLYEPDDKSQLARSQYINVSAPISETPVSVSVSTSKISTFSTEPSTLQTSTTLASNSNTAPTDSSSSDETDSSSETKSSPGLSSAATGGVAAGAAIGGLLIIGGIGWLAWRRLARKKQDRPVSELPADLPQQHHLDPPQAKAELSGDPGIYPTGYARSTPGIHEAP